MKNRVLKSAIILTFAGLCACAGKPRNATQVGISASVSEELAQTRRDLDYEKANQLALLSPENFRKAEDKLEDAEEGLARSRNSGKVAEDLSQARGWLDDARQVGQRTRGLFAAPLDARANAITVFDPDNRELIKTDRNLKETADDVEKGKSVSERAIRKLTTDYNEVELNRIERTQISPIKARIKQARDMGGKRHAPQAFDRAEADLKAIERTIKIVPYDRAQVAGRIQNANKSSSELLSVTSEIKASNGRATEAMVMNNRMRDKEFREKQEAAALLAKQEQDKAQQELNQARETSGEIESENRELRTQMEDLKKTAQPQVVFQKLQESIPAADADILMNGAGKIVVRVRELQFKSNSADLSPEAAAKLTKVRSALNDINPKKILVEGHTDAIGSVEKNKLLSETRAESVATVLTAGDNLKKADVETAGLGADKPLTENRTKDGRKENRRVEITIETL